MYEKILTKRDAFIQAAINAEDPKMKAMWINRAEKMNKLLQLFNNYPIGEIVK